MKSRLFFALGIAAMLSSLNLKAQIEDPKKVASQDATDRTNSNISSGVDNGLGKAEGTLKGLFGKKRKKAEAAAQNNTAQTGNISAAANGGNINVYNNYDFVPGDKIIFSDGFYDTQDGEFPEQWELMQGQGTTNKIYGYTSFVLTDGNYVRVKPRVKAASYLTDPFTVEYDYYFTQADYPLKVFFSKAGSTSGQEASLSINADEVSYNCEIDGYSLQASLSTAMREENFWNKWHHIAIAYKNKQLKVYVDQARMLSVPDMHIVPASIHFGGIASQDAPLIFTNVKIASGGGMNMLGKKFTDAKLVTHGINFDVDQSTIRPESMGTLNQIKGILNDNPDLKFEIDGHTDNSGSSPHNITLSQARADAVKTQLISMGIDASRLTTKGYGDGKPMSDNGTPEGKANNRRVEFVKI